MRKNTIQLVCGVKYPDNCLQEDKEIPLKQENNVDKDGLIM